MLILKSDQVQEILSDEKMIQDAFLERLTYQSLIERYSSKMPGLIFNLKRSIFSVLDSESENIRN